MSRRRDAGAHARVTALLDALDAWRAGLPADTLADPADGGRDVAAVLDAARSRRAALPAADARTLAALEEGLVADAVALADAVPAHAFAVPRASLAGAVRSSLASLAARAPGHLVEVRVPPWGAVQIGAPGVESVHSRGTPPNVVETDPRTWLALASGRLSWADAVASRRVAASGIHADLSGVLGAARR